MNRILLFAAFMGGFYLDVTAQTVQGSLNFSSVTKPVARRTPYGKTVQAETNSSKKIAAIWLESEKEVEIPQTEIVYLDQKDIQFSPRFVVIKQGEKVRVRNSDPVYHNVFSLSSVKKFDIGRRQKGEFLDVLFEKSGIIQVFCDIHSHMNAEILVLPKTAFVWKNVEENQTFSFEGIPLGTYFLKAYTSGFQEFSRKITVTENSTVSMDIKLEVK